MDDVVAPVRVVLVDDDALLRRTLEAQLHRSGGVVATFAGATEALCHVEAHAVDLLVTDLEMPGLDGAALIAAVRDRGLACRCVLITGRGLAHGEACLATLGVTGVSVIAKPISLAVMRRVLAG